MGLLILSIVFTKIVMAILYFCHRYSISYHFELRIIDLCKHHDAMISHKFLLNKNKPESAMATIYGNLPSRLQMTFSFKDFTLLEWLTPDQYYILIKYSI